MLLKKNNYKNVRLLFWGMITLLFASQPLKAANIALIIDDIGYKKQDVRAFDLPVSVTFSILPHTPFSNSFAARAQQQQREVMLHIPMESLAGKALGPGALTAEMPVEAITRQLKLALNSVPNAIGINNHMGSKLTQLTRPMTATMDFLRDQGMYFVDSRTTRYSKAETIAKNSGVKTLHRHVFLDHNRNEQDMQKELDRLVRIAKKYTNAVGIAHPHSETLAFLNKQLPNLERQGVQLVPLSSMLPARSPQIALAQSAE